MLSIYKDNIYLDIQLFSILLIGKLLWFLRLCVSGGESSPNIHHLDLPRTPVLKDRHKVHENSASRHKLVERHTLTTDMNVHTWEESRNLLVNPQYDQPESQGFSTNS